MSLRQTRSASKSSAPSMSMPPPQAANMARKRKAPAKIADIDGPSTPKRKTKTLPSSVLTPTPAAINVMAHTTRASSPATPKSKKARRADPKATNAPLQTPGGSKVLKTYPSDLLESSSPSKGGIITTDNLLEKACAHLCAVDPKLKPLVERHTCKMFTPEGLAENVEPFEALVSSIISQQVSGAAAASIKRKFISLFSHPLDKAGQDYFPPPSEVADKSIEFLRTAGLSQRKAEYIQGLAEKFTNGELSARMLIDASDEELLEKLIGVRGLGRWSVEMFACFALKRMDIFALGDLGVQRGMAAYLGKDVNRLKTTGKGKYKYLPEAEMIRVSEPFAPYRSLFMWYMWRVEDVNVETMEKKS